MLQDIINDHPNASKAKLQKVRLSALLTRPHERRMKTRRKTRMNIALVWGDPAQISGASFRNINEDGACLALKKGIVTPDKFDIIQIRGGILHEAEVVWRGDGVIGVAFQKSHILKKTKEPSVLKRKQIWEDLVNNP